MSAPASWAPCGERRSARAHVRRRRRRSTQTQRLSGRSLGDVRNDRFCQSFTHGHTASFRCFLSVCLSLSLCDHAPVASRAFSSVLVSYGASRTRCALLAALPLLSARFPYSVRASHSASPTHCASPNCAAPSLLPSHVARPAGQAGQQQSRSPREPVAATLAKAWPRPAASR